MTFLLILFAFVNAADGWTTWQVYRFGGYERNPIIKWFIARVGLYATLLLFKITPVVGVWIWAFNGLDWRVFAGMCVAFGAVTVWNLVQLRKQKELNRG